MFEVRFFVDDKKLAKVMWALDGEIAGMPTIIPVKGAEVKGTKIKAKTTTEGTLKERFIASVAGNGNETMTTRDLEAAMTAAGGASISAASYIQRLSPSGFLKRVSRGVYKVDKTKVNTALTTAV